MNSLLPKMQAFPAESIQSILPELQTYILDRIPQFCRLNKTTVAGKYHLDKMSQKSITKDEFVRYIETYEPKKFFIITNYSIIEGINDMDDYDYKEYDLKKYPSFFIFTTHSSFGCTLTEILDKIKGEISYDIITQNIYKHFRTECTNLKEILAYKIINLCKISPLLKSSYDITTISNSIINNLALAAHNIMLGKDLKITIRDLSMMIHRLLFDQDGNYNGDKNYITQFALILDQHYHETLSNLRTFIVNYK